MTTRPVAHLSAVVLDTPDPRSLAGFYQRLLGWERREDEPEWVRIGPVGGGPGLSFQAEARHRAPSWPAAAGDQQMQLHLDLQVDDLDAAVALARSLGGRLADEQPQEDVRVVLDPAGHPFCFFLAGA
jgi:catechol 2,3-dioxygenase-like lactoylglutathione lyase family enzyme